MEEILLLITESDPIGHIRKSENFSSRAINSTQTNKKKNPSELEPNVLALINNLKRNFNYSSSITTQIFEFFSIKI